MESESLVIAGLALFIQFFSWLFFVPMIWIEGSVMGLYIPACMAFGLSVTPVTYIYGRYLASVKGVKEFIRST